MLPKRRGQGIAAVSVLMRQEERAGIVLWVAPKLNLRNVHCFKAPSALWRWSPDRKLYYAKLQSTAACAVAFIHFTKDVNWYISTALSNSIIFISLFEFFGF